MEGKAEEQRIEGRFKELLVANEEVLRRAVIPEVFPPSSVTDEVIEAEEFEWIVPQSEEEALALLAEADQIAFGDS